ncbi:cell cycle protein GpsB [Lysinibacillus alkalisoli]|uniref:Cell cycle protein GpsB n=1 Tax=Lysinibacillus alkalisoli TaxID=1911548 RepID=A0A917G9S4_9BACI|nr:cell division regulator GpsB [Lysinibacillus alkalisoli]GGG31348.1 cell cycle protein GpsB [Lysinibacillus alkalisoli]
MERKLTADQIFEKEFSVSFRGYNTDEVNDFLDIIIEDYNTMEKLLADLQEENRRLKSISAEAPPRQSPTMSRTNTTNFDILKRISNLEKHVFGDKLQEE